MNAKAKHFFDDSPNKLKMPFLPKLFLVTLLLVATSSEITEECRQETEPLLTDSNLAIAQSVIFEDYTASFNDKCDFSLQDVGCSIEFEGDARTYKALCEGQGGQVFNQPVVLSCLLGTVEYDLGSIPTCVGPSCNLTSITTEDLSTEQSEAFLDNLTIIGCEAGTSAADNYSVMASVMGTVILTVLSSMFMA